MADKLMCTREFLEDMLLLNKHDVRITGVSTDPITHSITFNIVGAEHIEGEFVSIDYKYDLVPPKTLRSHIKKFP